MKKILMIIMCLVVVSVTCFNYVEAGLTGRSDTVIMEDGAREDEDSGIRYPTLPDVDGDGVIDGVTNLANRVWSTAIVIVQALAIGCVIYAGLRYMYASADKKADIKKGLMYLAIGSIFVFAATTVIKFIYSAGIELF